MTEQRVHEFVADTSIAADWRGERRCTCGLPRPNRVHDVPEPDPEAAVIDARILGETPEERTEEGDPL